MNVNIKKKTFLSAYNQLKLMHDLQFPNYQKGEPLYNLVMEIKRERVKIKGYLEEFALSKKEADDLIMSAREKVYKD